MTRNPIRSARPPGTAAAGAGRYGVIGVAPGQTTTNVEFGPITLGGVNCYGAYDTSSCYSDPVVLQPPPPATVTPSVFVNCSAATLVMGQGAGAFDTAGTCTATVNPSGGTFAWSANKHTVGLSGSGATITYSAAAESSAVGDTTLALDYTASGESASVTVAGITVRDPTSLMVVSDTGTEMTFPCSAADGGYPCGAERQIEYQLRDALGAIGVASIPIAEGFVPGSDSCGTQTGDLLPWNRTGLDMISASMGGPLFLIRSSG